MQTLYDSKGKKIVLTTELGRGGEGSVYAVEGDASTVGKVYHQPISREKSEKLRWMSSNKTPSLLKVAAWTTETLHEGNAAGKMVGFLMPAVKAKEIHELYSPKSRRTHFPDADWRFLIHTAANIARAFNNVHQAGHVIGDVNHGNCAVLPDGTVKLIDCDSYSIQANGKTYPCEVGITTHIPPELQGQSLRGVTRRQQHDNFGLAVIIFQLLFLGRHPFSGKPLGKGEKSLEDCIREHRFAYGEGAASRQIQPPPGVPPLDSASAELAKLFERAFLTRDDRPVPSVWVEALEKLSKNLTVCRQYSGHHYLKTLSACPWCEVEKQTGNAVFPIKNQTAQQASESGFNIVTIERLLGSLQIPKDLSPQPVKQALVVKPPPDPKLVESNKSSGILLTLLIAVEIPLLICLSIYAGGIGSFVIGMALAFAAYRLTDKVDPQIKKETLDKLQQNQTDWKKLEAEWKQGEPKQNLLNEIDAARQKISEYKNLPNLRQQKLKQLEDQIYERQLEDYLDRFRIDQANIKGIGWNRAITLQSYGIETAADVDSRRIMSISGFGPTYTQYLVMWRDGLKARFCFDPRKGVNPLDIQRVETEFLNSRRTMESWLQNQIARLQSKAANINGRNSYLEKKAADLSLALAQAEVNRSAVSNFSLGIAAIFLLAFGVPIGSGIVKLALAPPAPVASLPAAVESPIPSPTSTIIQNSNAVAANDNTLATNVNVNLANSNVNQANANLSMVDGIDISLLSDYEKTEKGQEYYDKGVQMTRANNYAEAARLYQYAIKFDNSKANYYHELGYALFRQRRYQESVAALQNAVRLGSSNNESKEILGLSYIELKKWKEARELFSEITRTNYTSFSAYYNLAIAAKNTGDYSSSASALERAVQIKPGEAKARYELGRCYIKLGRTSEVEEQYQILLTQSPQLAEQLKQEANSSN